MVCPITGAESYVCETGKSMKAVELTATQWDGCCNIAITLVDPTERDFELHDLILTVGKSLYVCYQPLGCIAPSPEEQATIGEGRIVPSGRLDRVNLHCALFRVCSNLHSCLKIWVRSCQRPAKPAPEEWCTKCRTCQCRAICDSLTSHSIGCVREPVRPMQTEILPMLSAALFSSWF